MGRTKHQKSSNLEYSVESSLKLQGDLSQPKKFHGVYVQLENTSFLTQEDLWDNSSSIGKKDKIEPGAKSFAKQDTYISHQKDLNVKFTIFVGNITSETTEEEVVQLFSQFGSGVNSQ